MTINSASSSFIENVSRDLGLGVQAPWGRMHNTVITATSKLKSIYDGVVFTSVCITPS